MRPLLCLLLLCSSAAFAQQEPDSSGDDAPSMMRPGSDSPEASHARKYDGSRHRAQAFLVPMDEKARTPTTRVATAVETVLLHTPIYQVVDLGHALSVESTAATPTATSLNQLIAGASEEVGRGTAGRSVSALAEKFSLERVLIGSVRSQEESRVSVVLALVDAVKHRIIAAKTLTLSADGTDADQIELDTQAAARKLVAADDDEAQASADAPSAAPARKPVMPGAIPASTSDEPGLVGHERKVAIPADAPAPASKEAIRKKQEKNKSKGLQGKTGTEGWDDE